MRHFAKFRPIGQSVAEIWLIFNFSRWRKAAKFEVLPAYPLWSANVSHCARFCASSSNHLSIRPFLNFQDGGRPPSWIFKVGNFSFRPVRRPNMRHCAKFRADLSNLRRYGQFFIFQDGDRPSSWICFTRVWTTHEEYLVVFVTVQNLVVLSVVISIVCKF